LGGDANSSFGQGGRECGALVRLRRVGAMCASAAMARSTDPVPVGMGARRGGGLFGGMEKNYL
jgi:hypothetical protein